MKNLPVLVSALPQPFWNSADSTLSSLQSGRGIFHQQFLQEAKRYSSWAAMPLKYHAEQVQVQLLLQTNYLLKTKRRILLLPSTRTTERNINFHHNSSKHVNKHNSPISPSAGRDNECRWASFIVYWNGAVVCLRIGCPCQDGVLQWRNVSFQTWLPHRVLQQVPLPPGTRRPNELVRFICSILTQVDNTSTISLSTFKTGMHLSLKWQ